VRRLQPVLADANPAPRLQRERARARVELGLDQLALGRRGDAMASFETALSELARLETEPTPTRAEALGGLARARTP
jgi:Tfp pilus assembly protein PilF